MMFATKVSNANLSKVFDAGYLRGPSGEESLMSMTRHGDEVQDVECMSGAQIVVAY